MEDAVYILILILVLIYGCLKHIYRYWDRQGFLSVKASIPFGNFNSYIQKQRSLSSNLYDLYAESLIAPYIGIYISFRPALLVRHPQVIKRILKDKSTFNNMGKQNSFIGCRKQNELSEEENFYMSSSLPIEKLKKIMNSAMLECNHLTDYFYAYEDNTNTIDVNHAIKIFSYNTVSSILFDNGVNLWKTPNHPLALLLQSNLRENFSKRLIQIAKLSCPR